MYHQCALALEFLSDTPVFYSRFYLFQKNLSRIMSLFYYNFLTDKFTPFLAVSKKHLKQFAFYINK